jgi:hypothetical protein
MWTGKREFLIRNKNQFLVNSEIYHIDTRQHANLHQSSVNMTKYQKGVYYLGVKVFNMLPSYIKTEFDNPKKFKAILQNFLWKFLLFLGCIFWTSKKLNLHMILIDIWKFWHACSFSFLHICIIYLFVYITRGRFNSLFVTQWTNFFSVSTLNWFLHTPLFYYTK